MYEPREDSYLLQKLVKLETKTTDKVLDMGTGSGIQAKTAYEITKDVKAVDINPECLNINNIKTIQSDLFNNIQESYDLIIFNPPYLPEDPNEPKDSALATTGGKEGHEIIQSFLNQAKQHLNKNGRILLLYSSLSGKIEKIAKDYNIEQLAEESHFMENLYVSKLTPKSL
ncbi:methyltransferase [Candidatus Woesearchaeota archaeon]|nr:methyltransferase [Candidatus Woesearchaeota archaeon]